MTHSIACVTRYHEYELAAALRLKGPARSAVERKLLLETGRRKIYAGLFRRKVGELKNALDEERRKNADLEAKLAHYEKKLSSIRRLTDKDD